MNSEELEKSLRTEFKSYLNDALADMRQEVFQLQYKIDAEVDKYKSQIDEIFKDFNEQIREDREFSDNFKETIVEHLRLARDDGATITAQAIAEAEKLENGMSPSSFDVSDLRDAINDISSQTSQATILRSLINHAEKYVPRGAFFVVKNQNLVGWRVFGDENPSNDNAIREIFFDIAKSTILGESVNSLHVVESTYGSFQADSLFLDPLNLGEPTRMFAVPLIARGRGVAAIYADPGNQGNDVNVAALETLVRIAGLTVELLAGIPTAARSAASAQSSYTPSPAYVAPQTETVQETTEPEEKEVETVKAEEIEDYQSYEQAYEIDDAEETVEAEEETYEVSGNDEEVDDAIADSYKESFETAPAVEYEEIAEAEPETEDSYETVATESIEESRETETAEFTDETDSVGEVVEAEEVEVEETYQVSDETETTTDYDISPIQKPAEPFTEQSYESLDTNEYLGSETSSDEEQETLTDDFVSDDDLIEQVQASDETVEEQEIEVEEVTFAEVQEEETEVSDSFETSVSPEVVESYQPTPVEVSASDSETEEVQVSADEQEVEESKEEIVSEEKVEEVAAAAPAKPVRSRFASRNVDLPIEVSEDERKLHNDARRFARLLVSEIKLYNEQKVIEGRDAGDVYDRLREAIDRSREMYDKRVQPPVAKRFDYFHYEVVNTLGDGEESILGSTYPGATV